MRAISPVTIADKVRENINKINRKLVKDNLLLRQLQDCINYLCAIDPKTTIVGLSGATRANMQQDVLAAMLLALRYSDDYPSLPWQGRLMQSIADWVSGTEMPEKDLKIKLSVLPKHCAVLPTLLLALIDSRVLTAEAAKSFLDQRALCENGKSKAVTLQSFKARELEAEFSSLTMVPRC